MRFTVLPVSTAEAVQFNDLFWFNCFEMDDSEDELIRLLFSDDSV